MAIHVVLCVPTGNDSIGKRVETCHMEGFDKEFVIVVAELCELAVVLDDGQCVEHDEQNQCHESLPSLLALDLEYVESFFYHDVCF